MSDTATVRIPLSAKKDLEETAKELGISQSQAVVRLLQEHKREKFFKELAEAASRLRADPIASKEYDDEVRVWDVTLNDGMEGVLTSINKGQVWLVEFPELENIVGREQAGNRPALVLSRDDFNSNDLDLVVVIPTTTVCRSFPSHVPVKSPEGGLKEDSFIMCEQVKSISNERLVRHLSSVSDTTMSRVEEIIGYILDLPFRYIPTLAKVFILPFEPDVNLEHGWTDRRMTAHSRSEHPPGRGTDTGV